MSLLIGSFTGLLGLVGLVCKLLALLALVDAAIQPSRAYPAADRGEKRSWVVGLVIASLIAGISLFGLLAVALAVYYLVDVRRSLRAARGR